MMPAAPIASRVLLLVWDAADWRVLRPLLHAGRMPRLQRFLADSASARLIAPPPLTAPVLFTTLLTGQRPHRHGILHRFEPDERGENIRPVTSASRRAPALWELTQHAGLRAALVNLPVTHPAPATTGVVLSERFFDVGFQLLGARRPAPPEHALHPPHRLAEFEPCRVWPDELDPSVLTDLIPGFTPQQLGDARSLLTASTLARTASIHAAAAALLEHDPHPLTIVRYDGLGALWRVLGPRLAAQTDGLLQRFTVFHDLLLGALLDRAGDDAAVILLSPRGYDLDQHVHPPGYTRSGFLALRAANVHAGQQVAAARLMDVAPTVLALLGLPVPVDLAGRPMQPLTRTPWPVQHVLTSPVGPSHQPDAHDAAEEQRLVGQLLALGYTEPRSPVADARVAACRLETQLNTARSLIDGGEASAALALCRSLPADVTASPQVRAFEAEACYASGDLPGSRAILLDLVARHPADTRLSLALAHVELQMRRAADALDRLQPISGDLPAVELLRASCYARLRRWTEADDALRRARSAADSEWAHDLRAMICLARGEPERAAEAALRAIDVDRSFAPAHYHLALALSRLGRWNQAELALRACLALDPEHLPALRRLAALYRGPLPRESQHRLIEQRITQAMARQHLRPARPAAWPFGPAPA